MNNLFSVQLYFFEMHNMYVIKKGIIQFLTKTKQNEPENKNKPNLKKTVYKTKLN